MKAILFSDIHLGLSLNSPIFHETSLEFAKWMKKIANDKDIDTLICTGDVFHNRKAITIDTIHIAYEFFNILKDFKIKILTGNHDCYYLDNSSIHSISLLKNWDNIEVYDVPFYEVIDDKKVGYIPWGTNVDEMENCDIMFGHFEITGFQMGASSFCKEGMTSSNLLKKCPMIFSGHFHKPQKQKFKKGEIVYLGSPYQHDWGEANQDKYIYSLDFETSDLEFIENTLSPKHIEVSNKDEFKKAKGDIIRIYAVEGDDWLDEISNDLKDMKSVETIIEDVTLIESKETIKDFKSSNIKDTFVEVLDYKKDLDKKFKSKVLKKCNSYYDKVE